MNRRKVGRPKGSVQPLDWRHRTAAFMLAWSWGTRQDIADYVDVSRMALWKWSLRPDFRKLCEKEQRNMVASIRNRGHSR